MKKERKENYGSERRRQKERKRGKVTKEKKKAERKKERKITTVRGEERKESVFLSLGNILQDCFIKWFTLELKLLKGKLTTN